ncbi:M56 family metallopeptidase [Frankia sp. Cas4]|uniref:M56 family metallopeptidase n=1 Tax=Frankia sp. Cas4 TaxID=3073927 RepID=UPI002AD28356|nr:M56 family metallopeptidase [Frankia sp. Cas4]
MMTAAILALFSGALAWPVPRLLAAAHWPSRCPRSAIVLWQAVGLAGGVSALIAVIAFTFAPLSANVAVSLRDHADHLAAGEPLAGLGWINLIGLAVASMLTARLFGVLALSTSRTARQRRRHRHLVDLAGRDHDNHDNHGERARRRGQLRVLDHPVAVAYCLPGVRHTRVVVSKGLLAALAPDELEAVLAHEEAHARGRHDLVIQPFVAWQETFPFLPPAREATAAVSLLVEMLADDAAARCTSGQTLARALARLGVARSPVPAGAVAITGAPHHRVSARGRTLWPPRASHSSDMTESKGMSRVSASPAEPSRSPIHAPLIARISRLLDPSPRTPLWAHAAVYLTAAAVSAFPVVVLLAT